MESKTISYIRKRIDDLHEAAEKAEIMARALEENCYYVDAAKLYAEAWGWRAEADRLAGGMAAQLGRNAGAEEVE